jgi:hypothetical protein
MAANPLAPTRPAIIGVAGWIGRARYCAVPGDYPIAPRPTLSAATSRSSRPTRACRSSDASSAALPTEQPPRHGGGPAIRGGPGPDRSAWRAAASAAVVRAMTRTVLLDHAAASSSMKRVDDASAAWARSPCRAPATVTSSRLVAPGARLGRSQVTSAANSRCPTGSARVPQSSAGAASGARRGAAPPARSARRSRRRRSARRAPASPTISGSQFSLHFAAAQGEWSSEHAAP